MACLISLTGITVTSEPLGVRTIGIGSWELWPRWALVSNRDAWTMYGLLRYGLIRTEME